MNLKIKRIKLNGKYGLRDDSGNWIVDPIMDEISDINISTPKWNDIKNQWNSILSLGSNVIKDYEDGISFINNNLHKEGGIVAKYKGKYGILNFDGNWLINPLYDEFRLGGITTGEIIFKDHSNDMLFSTTSIRGEKIFNHHLKARKNDKWGLIDNKFRTVLEFEYDEIENLNSRNDINAPYTIYKDNKYRLIDKNIIPMYPFEFDEIDDFNNNDLIPVCSEGKWGYINSDGRIIHSLKFDECTSFLSNDSKYAAVKLDSKWGIIEHKNNPKSFVWKFYPLFDSILDYKNEQFEIMINKKEVIIDQAGNIVISKYKYEQIHSFNNSFLYSFSEGLGRVMINGKWGYIDEKENIIIEPQFEFCGDFSEGLAYVILSSNGYVNVVGYINNLGDWHITPRVFGRGDCPGNVIDGEIRYYNVFDDLVIMKIL